MKYTGSVARNSSWQYHHSVIIQLVQQGFKTYTCLPEEPVTHLCGELLLLVRMHHITMLKIVGVEVELPDRDTGSQTLFIIIT